MYFFSSEKIKRNYGHLKVYVNAEIGCFPVGLLQIHLDLTFSQGLPIILSVKKSPERIKLRVLNQGVN